MTQMHGLKERLIPSLVTDLRIVADMGSSIRNAGVHWKMAKLIKSAKVMPVSCTGRRRGFRNVDDSPGLSQEKLYNLRGLLHSYFFKGKIRVNMTLHFSKIRTRTSDIRPMF